MPPRHFKRRDDNKNFHFKDDKAYTEDNVLIYNVFTYKVPKDLTEDDLHKHFSSFGQLDSTRFVSDKKRRVKHAVPKVGFIYYADPVAAAKVLKQQYHTIRNKRISVKSCDSWYQPKKAIQEWDGVVSSDFKDTRENANTATDSTGHDTPYNILELNDDCLELICKKLDLRTQVNFSRVCQRFRSVFQMSSKLEYKVFELDKLEPLTLWEVKDFFKYAGRHIEKLYTAGHYRHRERVFEFISYSCPNVKNITFSSIKIRSNYLCKLLEKMKMLTTLHLVDCSLKDNAIAAMHKLPKLENLILSENYELTGKNLEKLRNIKSLNLFGCSNLLSRSLIEVFRHSKELTTLNIQRCERVTGQVFQEVAAHCKNLVTLQASCPEAPYECVARLPHLKNLELISCSHARNIRQQLFVELAEHKADQLESLKFNARNYINYERATLLANLKHLTHLSCPTNEHLDDDCLRKFAELSQLEELVLKRCPAITNTGLLYLLRKCTKLKNINIQRCSKITNTFVYDAIKLLEQATPQPQQSTPLTCLVSKTAITEYILNDSRYVAAAAYIKLSFQAPFYDEDDPFDDFTDSDGFSDDDDDDDDFDFHDDDFGDDYDLIDLEEFDEDELHHAYNLFGGQYPVNINDFIW